MGENFNLYQTYIKEIEERKVLGLSPKPIDDGDLLAVIIDQIMDLDNKHRKSISTFYLQCLAGHDERCRCQSALFKAIILGESKVDEISSDFAFELLAHERGHIDRRASRLSARR